MKKQTVQLRWKLLEYKCMYYHPEKVHPSWHDELTISDVEYDALEKEYERLSGEKYEVVDFPLNSPSGNLVLSKLKEIKK